MTTIIELRKEIVTSLKTVHPRVYSKKAPKDAVFPYLVYDLPNAFSEDPEIFIFDIDGWDDSEDTTALEILIDSVDALLHRKTIFTSGKVSATFYRDKKLSPTDDDPRINRRKYTYQIRVF